MRLPCLIIRSQHHENHHQSIPFLITNHNHVLPIPHRTRITMSYPLIHQLQCITPRKAERVVDHTGSRASLKTKTTDGNSGLAGERKEKLGEGCSVDPNGQRKQRRKKKSAKD